MANASAPKTDARWQAEEDARTLQRAEEIKADSKRYAAALKILRKQVKVMNKVVSMKDLYLERRGKE